MKLALLTILAGLTFIGGAGAAAAQSASSSCATPGSAVLANVTPAKADLLPSLGNQISGYGRQAKASNCLIALICVSTDGSDAAKDIARKQCVVVRDLLVKGGFAKDNIDTSRKSPGNGREPGVVYFSVY